MKAVRVPRSHVVECARALGPGDSRAAQRLPAEGRLAPAGRWISWQVQDAALALMALQPDETVLDYGCGAGVALPSLSRHARRVLAVDARPAGAQRMVELESLGNVEVLRRDADVRALDRLLGAGTIDCARVLDVPDRPHELDGVVEAIRSSLSPRGRVVLGGPTESLAARIGRGVAELRGLVLPRRSAPVPHADVFETRRAFERAGFRVEREQYLPPWPLPEAYALLRLVPS